MELTHVPGPDGYYWLGSGPDRPIDVDAPVYVAIDHTKISGWEEERDLEEYFDSLREIAAAAPEGSRVTVQWESESDYEGGYDPVRIIGYYREPTEEERAERREINARIARKKEAEAARKAQKEREEYERLKVKFSAQP